VTQGGRQSDGGGAPQRRGGRVTATPESVTESVIESTAEPPRGLRSLAVKGGAAENDEMEDSPEAKAVRDSGGRLSPAEAADLITEFGPATCERKPGGWPQR